MSRHQLNLLIIFLITLSFFGYFIRPGDWNINSRLGLVKAIVEEKRLTIDSYLNSGFDSNDVAYVNGHYYSDKAIGVSVLGALVYAPIYGVAKHPLSINLFIMLTTVLAISVPCALLAPIFYSVALRVIKNKWIALLIALSISLATQFFPYAGAFYGHSLAALLAVSVFFLWMEVNHFNASITSRRLLLTGFLMGFMVLTEYTTLLIAIPLFAYMIIVVRSVQKTWNWRIVGWFALGGVVPLILFASYNWVCFGSPFALGYAYVSFPEFKELHSEGLMGIGWPNLQTLLYITINPMMGILIQAPVLLLSIGGFVIMQRVRKLRLELVVSTLIILIYCLANSGVRVWWGGDAFTVRYLIPILPFFGVFMMYLPPKYAPLYICVALFSFFQMLIASETIYHPLDEIIRAILKRGFVSSWKTSLLYQEVLPKLLHNKLVLTWGNYLFGVESWYMNLAIPVFVASLLLVIFYFVNKREDKVSAETTLFQTVKPTEYE